MLIEDVNDVKLATQNAQSSKKKIFRNKLTVTSNNFFFDDKMLDWIDENGYSVIGTCARNLLPGDIDKKYLHAEKHQSRCPYSKVARFTEPIVAVKNRDGYQYVHVSFQSASSTNITTVNCLNECKLFAEIH